MRVGRFQEPLLKFGYDQCAHDPRDGLELFGPVKDNLLPKEVRLGVIGTKVGVEYFSQWLERVNRPIESQNKEAPNQRNFLGFEATFSVDWPSSPTHEIIIDEDQLNTSINISDPYIRANKTVSLYLDSLNNFRNQQVDSANVWFVVVPDLLAKNCRPQSKILKSESTDSELGLVATLSIEQRNQGLLFEEDRQFAEAYDYAADFHDQIKARLLSEKVVTQIMRESTLCPYEVVGEVTAAKSGREHDAEVAWNATTTTLYKSGANLWRLSDVRPGVCYIGLVFKRDDTNKDKRYACCGAQMFLDSAEGLVFRGALGPWYSEDTREFHLSKFEARRLIQKVVAEYKVQTGREPSEIFVHGRARINQEEWRGFRSGCAYNTKIVCVTIKESNSLKLYRRGEYPILRGTHLIVHPRKAFLFTRGFTLGLGTYLGKETPNPLDITIDHGEADIATVLMDVMALTKLNFNQSKYSDGKPVTLRFADYVGRIMVATKDTKEEVLPFRHYI